MKILKIPVSVVILLLILTFTFKAHAESVLLENGQIVEELFYASLNDKQITCAGLINGAYISGRTITVGSSKIFIPLSDDLKSLKSKLKTTTTSVSQNKVKVKMKKLKARIKTENAVCAPGPGNEPPAPLPTSPAVGATPTPRPTATATPKGNTNFESNGDVTAAGKITFGIPSNLSANRETGRSLYNSSCAGCHTENTGQSFSYYKNIIRASPMFILDKSDQDMADITAYLRRFELN